jgi:hypothetical protein
LFGELNRQLISATKTKNAWGDVLVMARMLAPWFVRDAEWTGIPVRRYNMRMAIAIPRYTIEDLESFPDDGNRYELLDGMLLVTARCWTAAPGHREPDTVPVNTSP